MSEKEQFDLNELPDKEEMTAGDVAKLETDPDFIAFRDGTDVLPEHHISPEKAREIARIAREKYEEEQKKKNKDNK